MAQKVEIKDRVSAIFDGEPYMGTVSEVKGKKAVVEFDDDEIKTLNISKLTVHPKTEEKKKPKVKEKTLTPQEIEAKADEIRKKKVDAKNKAKAAEDAEKEEALSGVPLTQAEKDFVEKIGAKLNGRKYQQDGQQVRSARMDSLPSTQDMLKYSKLVKRKDVK